MCPAQSWRLSSLSWGTTGSAPPPRSIKNCTDWTPPSNTGLGLRSDHLLCVCFHNTCVCGCVHVCMFLLTSHVLFIFYFRYQSESAELSQWLSSALDRLEFWSTQSVTVPQELETVRDHLHAFLVRTAIKYPAKIALGLI